MPPKGTIDGGAAAKKPKAKVAAKGKPRSANADRVVLTECLLATDAEKHATSKSLYGDSAARISSNIYNIHDIVRHRAYEVLFRSIKGKTVLHLGCSMGLYSMLAARAGAKHVVAIDTSAVVDPARVVAEQNKLTNITFLRGRLRDLLKKLPETKFDVVLCEWMGTFLLNEDIMSDVLYARDNLLAEEGLICPNVSSIHVVGVSDYEFRLDTEEFWSNVYGFKMEPMKQLVRAEVEMCAIPRENLMTMPYLMSTVEAEKITGLTAEETKEYESHSEPKPDEGKDTENPVENRWTPYGAAQKGLEADFTITATHDCVINYLTFYVDASFVNKADPGANFVMGIRPGGQNAWTEVSVGLLDPLPVKAGERVTGHVKTFTPAEREGRVTVVQVEAKTEGKVADVKTTGEYFYNHF